MSRKKTQPYNLIAHNTYMSYVMFPDIFVNPHSYLIPPPKKERLKAHRVSAVVLGVILGPRETTEGHLTVSRQLPSA